MSWWERFFANVQQDLKLYIFVLGVFCLFRAGFIIFLNDYLSDATTYKDIIVALFTGLRISLKSAGIIAACTFIICTVGSLVFSSANMAKFRRILGYVYLTVLTVLFYARIPYYEQFHMAFNQFLFTTFHDDVYALFITLIQEYDLFSRLALVGITTMVLCRLLKLWLKTKTVVWPRFYRPVSNFASKIAVIVFLLLFANFAWFGGSMTYAYDIGWENSGVTKDAFLNEAILDDVQALYRAYIVHERLRASNGLTVDTAQMTQYGSQICGRTMDTVDVDNYFRRQAAGAKIPKPKHIFLIVGESYANWPLLPQYKDLNIANGLKSIIAQEEADYVRAFLPNGMGTIAGINGIVTGFTEVNLYVNYRAETYKAPYATALAPQMKRLGYKTYFWYAGPGSWERVKDFTMAQGFDEFHAYGDFESKAGNVWGSDDKYLFDTIETAFDGNSPTFHVVLTVSNHAPYTVNLEEEGFDAETVTDGLPEKLKDDTELIKKLGHFWYADKQMARFVKDMRQRYPDSLFIIVGDHADRLNLEPNPSLYARYGIPFVVYGRGVTKGLFPENAAGSHIDITPTIIELIAPKGFEYYTSGHNLAGDSTYGYNFSFWITDNYIGKLDDNEWEPLPGKETAPLPDLAAIKKQIEAVRAVSWWRIEHGKPLAI